MTNIAPEELEELKALETWLRECSSPYSDGRFQAWAESVNALIRSAEELADAKLGIAQFIAQNEGLQSAIGPLAEELGLVRERIAKWMILHSVATGHGDTVEDLLDELDVELTQLRARLEAAEKVVEESRRVLPLIEGVSTRGTEFTYPALSDALSAYDRTAK